MPIEERNKAAQIKEKFQDAVFNATNNCLNVAEKLHLISAQQAEAYRERMEKAKEERERMKRGDRESSNLPDWRVRCEEQALSKFSPEARHAYEALGAKIAQKEDRYNVLEKQYTTLGGENRWDTYTELQSLGKELIALKGERAAIYLEQIEKSWQPAEPKALDQENKLEAEPRQQDKGMSMTDWKNAIAAQRAKDGANVSNVNERQPQDMGAKNHVKNINDGSRTR